MKTDQGVGILELELQRLEVELQRLEWRRIENERVLDTIAAEKKALLARHEEERRLEQLEYERFVLELQEEERVEEIG